MVAWHLISEGSYNCFCGLVKRRRWPAWAIHNVACKVYVAGLLYLSGRREKRELSQLISITCMSESGLTMTDQEGACKQAAWRCAFP